MSETHHREFSELPITVDRHADTPLPAQIGRALREAIDRDALRPGEAVPSSRELATRIGVARGVVVAAYEQLIAEGYLSAAHGRGTRVHPELRSIARGEDAASPAPMPATRPGDPVEPADPQVPVQAPDVAHATASTAAYDAPPLGPLAPGLPDTSAIDTPAWRAAWRHAASHAIHEAPALGDTRLRAEIAEHLRRMRGTTRPPEDVIVTAGSREGLGLLLSALGTTRGRALTLGVEDPGYPSLRRVASRHGARIVALPVDGEGLVTSKLPAGILDAILVTPSHQYPLGGSLPLARRRELLDWAHASGAIIIEDDYDSELRHSGSPLPALAALDDREHGCVALLGTFSKTVSHALSAGFLVVPETLSRLVTPVRRELGGPVSAIVQAALAEYLASGELRRHTARMRRRYAARRELVVERLFGVPGVRVRPMSGGLHAVVELSGGTAAREAAVLRHAAALGAVPLSAYWHGRNAAASRYGLIIGTGGSLDEVTFDVALHELRRMLVTASNPAVRMG